MLSDLITNMHLRPFHNVINISGQIKKANKRSVLENIFSNPPHSLGNPVTTYFPGHPRAVFLQNLKIGGSSWRCNCDGIG